MKRRPLYPVALAFTVFATVACSGWSAAMPGGDPETAAGSKATASMRYEQLPIRMCIHLDPEQVVAMHNGQLRLILSIRHLEVSRRYSPPFILSVIDPDSGWQAEVERFAMHPDIVATGRNQPDAQQFSFDLSRHRPPSDIASNLCIELAIDSDDPTARLVAASELTVLVQLDPSGGLRFRR